MFWRKLSVGVSRKCPNLSGTPYYLKNGKRYGFQIWPAYSNLKTHLFQQSYSRWHHLFHCVLLCFTVFYCFVPCPWSCLGSRHVNLDVFNNNNTNNSEGSSEQKHIKNFREKWAWAYPWTADLFRVPVPLLSQEQENLLISNLASTFRGSIRTKG